jgi:hypothetical protein
MSLRGLRSFVENGRKFIARGSGSRGLEKSMLLYRDVPKEEIKKLKVGDFFIDSEIVSLKKGLYMISFVTKT